MATIEKLTEELLTKRQGQLLTAVEFNTVTATINALIDKEQAFENSILGDGNGKFVKYADDNTPVTSANFTSAKQVQLVSSQNERLLPNTKGEYVLVTNGDTKQNLQTALDELRNPIGSSNLYTQEQIEGINSSISALQTAINGVRDETKEYTDTQVGAVNDALATLQQTVENLHTLDDAKAYVDEREAAIRADMATADSNILSQAKDYADTKDLQTEAAARTYTDEKTADISSSLAQLRTDMENLGTLDEAKAYTDEKVTELATQMASADADTLAQANAHSDANDAVTLAAAKNYTDTVKQQLDDKISTLIDTEGRITDEDIERVGEYVFGQVNPKLIKSIEINGESQTPQGTNGEMSFTVDGSNTYLTGYDATTVDTSVIAYTDNIDTAVKKLEKADADNKAELLQEISDTRNGLSGRIDGIDGEITLIKGDITTIKENVTYLQTAYNSVNGRLDGLDGTVDGLRSDLDTNISYAESLGDKYDALEETVRLLGGGSEETLNTLAALRADIDNNYSYITQLQSDYNGIDGELGSLATTVNNNSDAISQLQEDVNSYAADLATLDGRVDSFEGNINLAISTANSASSAATTAMTTAQEAKNDAENATDIANTANETANAANETAATANANANAAKETANAAKTTADNTAASLTETNGRVTDAESAISAAETAISGLDERITELEGKDFTADNVSVDTTNIGATTVIGKAETEGAISVQGALEALNTAATAAKSDITQVESDIEDLMSRTAADIIYDGSGSGSVTTSDTDVQSAIHSLDTTVTVMESTLQGITDSQLTFTTVNSTISLDEDFVTSLAN